MHHAIYLARFKEFLTLMRDRTNNHLASEHSIYQSTPFTEEDAAGDAEFEKGCCVGFTLLERLSEKQGKLESWKNKLKVINDWSAEYDDLKKVIMLNGERTTVKDVFEEVMERVFTIQEKLSVLSLDPDQYVEGAEQEYVSRKGRVEHLKGDIIVGHFSKDLLAKYLAHPSIQALHARKDVMMVLADHRHITTQTMKNDRLEHFDINTDPESDPKKSVSADPYEIADAITYHLNDDRSLGDEQMRLMMQWLYIGDVERGSGKSALSAVELLEHEHTLDQLDDIDMALLDLRSYDEIKVMATQAMNDFFASLSQEELFACIYGESGKCNKALGWIYNVLDAKNMKRLLEVTQDKMFDEYMNPERLNLLISVLRENLLDKQKESKEAYFKLVDHYELLLTAVFHGIVKRIAESDEIPSDERFEYYDDIILNGFEHRGMVPWVLKLVYGSATYERDRENFEKVLKKEGLDAVPGKAMMACFAFLHRSEQSRITAGMEDMLLRTFNGLLKDHPNEKENITKLFQQAVKVFKLKIKNPELKAMSMPPKQPVLKESLAQPATLFKKPAQKRVSTKTAPAKRKKKK